MRALASIVVVALAACGGSTNGGNGSGSDGGGSDGSGSSSGGGDGAGSDPWVGTWACTGTESNTFTEPAGAKPEDKDTASTVTIVDNGDGTVTATSNPPDGGITCSLKSTVSGDTLTLVTGGQSCANNNGTTEIYTSGSATLSGNMYTASKAYTFSGTVAETNDAGASMQVMVAGSGTASSTCTRQ